MYDNSGNGNDLVVTKGGSQPIGDESFTSDGLVVVNNVIDYAGIVPYDNLLPFFPSTIELVFKADISSTANILALYSEATSASSKKMEVKSYSNGVLAFTKNTGGGGDYNSYNLPLELQNTFIHVVFTQIDRKKQNMYVNGIKVKSLSVSGTLDTFPTMPNGGRILIDNARSGTKPIKLLRMYDRVLSDSEILSNYDASTSML